MLSLILSGESGLLHSWPILTAGIFVSVTLLLSFYLMFEHLGAYNQPEVCFYMHSWQRKKILIVLICIIQKYFNNFYDIFP